MLIVSGAGDARRVVDAAVREQVQGFVEGESPADDGTRALDLTPHCRTLAQPSELARKSTVLSRPSNRFLAFRQSTTLALLGLDSSAPRFGMPATWSVKLAQPMRRLRVLFHTRTWCPPGLVPLSVILLGCPPPTLNTSSPGWRCPCQSDPSRRLDTITTRITRQIVRAARPVYTLDLDERSRYLLPHASVSVCSPIASREGRGHGGAARTSGLSREDDRAGRGRRACRIDLVVHPRSCESWGRRIPHEDSV